MIVRLIPRDVLSAVVVVLCSSPMYADELASIPFDRPAMLSLVSLKSVQAELRLKEEQRQEIEKLRETINEPGVLTNVEERLSAILDPQQVSRLRQIAWQVRPDEALRSEVVAEKLNLKSEQRSAIQKIWDEEQANLVSALRRIRFKTPEDRHAYIRKHLESTAQRMQTILSAEQLKDFTQLQGEVFKFPLD